MDTCGQTDGQVAVLAGLRAPVDAVICLGPHVQGSAAALLEYVIMSACVFYAPAAYVLLTP